MGPPTGTIRQTAAKIHLMAGYFTAKVQLVFARELIYQFYPGISNGHSADESRRRGRHEHRPDWRSAAPARRRSPHRKPAARRHARARAHRRRRPRAVRAARSAGNAIGATGGSPGTLEGEMNRVAGLL